MSDRSPGSSDLDDLRRRLYGPGASAEDVARYEAATDDPGPLLERPTGLEPARSRRGAGVLAAVAAVALGAGVVIGAAVGRSTPAASVSAAPSSASTPSASAISVIEGGLPAPASERSGFTTALRAGRQAGLLEYLYRHPDRLPPQLRTVQRAASSEYSGSGRGELTLTPSALAERGGRATVIVVLARAGGYGWRASRVVADADGSLSEREVATDSGVTGAGAPVVGTFGYGRGAPTALTVVAPAGTRWGAVVVFTD